MDKQHIINEIQRTAIKGKAVGQRRFETETGIKQHEWRGEYWARWGDALAEAGFSQNQWQYAHDESLIFRNLLLFARRLGKLPTKSEIDLERKHNFELPSSSAITRLGGRTELIERLLKFCAVHPEYIDVEKILKAIPPKEHSKKLSDKSATDAGGYVYLVGAQNAHKIGCTRAPYRRTAEIANQSAEGATLEHLIATDDPEGIERYWHDRFADKRIVGANKQSGEWFRLSKEDVKAFKRRKNLM